ncbi:hypothetical protein CF54_04195 [Streptomyces sp. Tu 6176]|uniref:hypothetical protein n=1 Tax=Streptomyces sp. Tu 6176 TaxID=1470557 RepID=UPI0004512C13|nr:hypothetical protein [Streptomyces sp. Tu 6176]EYT83978.1 hypothetical protein CF54_04195 [Streptomyces sp. Tu 6176]
MTTSDPHVVWGVVLAAAGAYLLAALVLKHFLDEHRAGTSAAAEAAAPAAQHAQAAEPDETAPITTVQPARARHRKDTPWT